MFHLQSKRRRTEPKKFEIKHLEYGGILLHDKSLVELIYLGDIYLNKENDKSRSCCWQTENSFNYHGIEKALCGKINEYNGKFTPKRIVVIQMK